MQRATDLPAFFGPKHLWSWVDVGRLDLRLRQPAQDRARDELRPVVRAQIPRRAVDAHELRQHLDDAADRMPPATSIAKHSRVHSSMTVRHFSCCPFAQVSNTKS